MEFPSFAYGALAALLIVLILASFGFVHLGSSGFQPGAVSGNAASASGIPEKCNPPAGQDLASWKEHLGHHAETQDCLKYYS